MILVKPPFCISFSHDQIPQQIDHARSRPGAAGGAANRAGHTSVSSRARVTFVWDDEPPGSTGQFPLFVRSANVYFRLTDFLISVSSDYAAHTCTYRVTLRHELEAHIYDPIRIFHSYRDVLVGRLNAIPVPTRDAPVRVASTAEAAQRQSETEGRIVKAIGLTRQQLLGELLDARNRHNSANSYRLVYSQCSDAEWARGR